MTLTNIKKDAENLSTKKNKLISIGGKINKKFPNYQFMGLIKIMNKDFTIMEKFYRKINDRKIDFTSFLDQIIKNKKLKITSVKTDKFWFEIDSIKDFVVAKKLVRRIEF